MSGTLNGIQRKGKIEKSSHSNPHQMKSISIKMDVSNKNKFYLDFIYTKLFLYLDKQICPEVGHAWGLANERGCRVLWPTAV
jgi:hypothetical protein